MVLSQVETVVASDTFFDCSTMSEALPTSRVAYPVLHPRRPIPHKTTYHTSPMTAKMKGNSEGLWLDAGSAFTFIGRLFVGVQDLSSSRWRSYNQDYQVLVPYFSLSKYVLVLSTSSTYVAKATHD